MLLNKKEKRGFIWIPKCAGHSIADILIKNDYQHWYEPNTTPHIHAQPLKKYIHNFEDYYLFSFVRNPWDRMLSLYSYLIQKQSHRLHEIILNFNASDWYNGFNHWLTCENYFVIDSYYNNCIQKRSQSEYLFDDNGNLLVDFVGKLENINEDYPLLANKINLPVNINKLNESKHSAYTDVYTSYSKEFILKWHYKDIKYFNYSF